MSWFRRAVGVRCRFGIVAAVVAVAQLGLSFPAAPLAAASPPRAGAAARAHPAGVPVKVLTPRPAGHARAANQVSKPFRATATRWPSPASARVVLPATRPGRAAGGMVRVAGTPLWVQAMPGEGRSASRPAAAAAKMTAAVLPHSRSAALGVSGVVFQLGRVAPASGRIRVRLDYSAFAQAYGGNYGPRLRLVKLPACALTTPRRAAAGRRRRCDPSRTLRRTRSPRWSRRGRLAGW